MGATLPKLTFILAATLRGCIPPAQAATRDPETLLTGPMDPTVDGDLLLRRGPARSTGHADCDAPLD